MTRTDDPRAELLGLAERLRHLRAEHQRAGADGTVRRKLEGEMAEVSDHLDRRLAGLLADEADRDAWRAHAHHGAPTPERPEEAEAAAPADGAPPERPSGRRPWPR